MPRIEFIIIFDYIQNPWGQTITLWARQIWRRSLLGRHGPSCRFVQFGQNESDSGTSVELSSEKRMSGRTELLEWQWDRRSSRGVAVKVEHDKLVGSLHNCRNRELRFKAWQGQCNVIAAPMAYNASVRATLMAGKSSTIKGDTWALIRLGVFGFGYVFVSTRSPSQSGGGYERFGPSFWRFLIADAKLQAT